MKVVLSKQKMLCVRLTHMALEVWFQKRIILLDVSMKKKQDLRGICSYFIDEVVHYLIEGDGVVYSAKMKIPFSETTLPHKGPQIISGYQTDAIFDICSYAVCFIWSPKSFGMHFCSVKRNHPESTWRSGTNHLDSQDDLPF